MGALGEAYLERYHTVASPTDPWREVRDATAHEQPADADQAIPAPRGREIERVEVAVDVVPQCTGAHAHDRLVLAQRRRLQARHVKGHAALDVSKARRRRVAAALDGELAASALRTGEDGYGLAHVLRGERPDDACGNQSRLLERPEGPRGERGGGDLVAQGGGKEGALRAVVNYRVSMFTGKEADWQERGGGAHACITRRLGRCSTRRSGGRQHRQMLRESHPGLVSGQLISDRLITSPNPIRRITVMSRKVAIHALSTIYRNADLWHCHAFAPLLDCLPCFFLVTFCPPSSDLPSTVRP